MEHGMIGITPRDHIKKAAIRRRTKVTDGVNTSPDRTHQGAQKSDSMETNYKKTRLGEKVLLLHVHMLSVG